MKKLLVCLTVAAFATMVSLQAGECAKEKSACSADAKTSCSSATQTGAKSCCAAGKVAKKRVDMSVKGATLLVRR